MNTAENPYNKLNSYELRHLVRHLIASNKLDTLYELLKDPQFIELRMANHNDVWELIPELLAALKDAPEQHPIHELIRSFGESIAGGIRSVVKEVQKATPKVFISYSHKDIHFLTRIQVHLRPMVKTSAIDLWDDTKIHAGQNWKKEIESALVSANVAILLISADFLASDFIVDNELPPLLKAAEERGIIILPVIVKPCSFHMHPNLSQFQAINDPRKPVLSLTEAEQEMIYVQIVERVYQVISSNAKA